MLSYFSKINRCVISDKINNFKVSHFLNSDNFVDIPTLVNKKQRQFNF